MQKGRVNAISIDREEKFAASDILKTVDGGNGRRMKKG
jgi:hypothetical protein